METSTAKQAVNAGKPGSRKRKARVAQDVIAKLGEKPPAKAKTKKKKADEPTPIRSADEDLMERVRRPLATHPKQTPVSKGNVSTLENTDKRRYDEDELAEFNGIIQKKLEEARQDYDLLKQTLANTDNNGTNDTSRKFHMIEDGGEALNREETAQLAARQEKFIKHLEDAQLRIRNKTYGICRRTGRLISKERLRLVPHATLSVEAKATA